MCKTAEELRLATFIRRLARMTTFNEMIDERAKEIENAYDRDLWVDNAEPDIAQLEDAHATLQWIIGEARRTLRGN